MAKIREGFVSNSSSSSFILPIKSKEITITISIDEFKDMMNNGDHYESSGVKRVLTTPQELDDYMVDIWGNNFKEHMEEEGIENQYNQLMSKIESGQNVLVGHISYGDYFLYELIKKMGGEIEN